MPSPQRNFPENRTLCLHSDFPPNFTGRRVRRGSTIAMLFRPIKRSSLCSNLFRSSGSFFVFYFFYVGDARNFAVCSETRSTKLLNSQRNFLRVRGPSRCKVSKTQKQGRLVHYIKLVSFGKIKSEDLFLLFLFGSRKIKK